jgi:hypothetical protein
MRGGVFHPTSIKEPTMQQPPQYELHVDGIGTFTFARRTMRLEFKIQAEYSRLTEGVETPTANLDYIAGVFSALRVLTLAAPEGWNLDDLDPLEQSDFEKVIRVHAALRDKEGSFRRKPAAAGAGDGPGNGGHDRVPLLARGEDERHQAPL